MCVQAFGYSTLHKAILDGVFDGFYFLGDAAYQSCPRILTPFQGAQSESERSFSFYQSSLRIHIERAFGLLVNRFGILWRPLLCAHRRIPMVLGACIGLHNFIISEEHMVDLAPPRLFRGARSHERPYFNPDGVPEDMLAGDRALTKRDVVSAAAVHQDQDMKTLRSSLMQDMQARGMRPPPTRGDALHAAMGQQSLIDDMDAA